MNFNDVRRVPFQLGMVAEIVKIWNQEVAQTTIYAPFTKQSFIAEIVNNKYFNKDGMVVYQIGKEIIGFGLATFSDQKDTTPGYLVFIVVKAKYQRLGIGKEILTILENYLRENNKTKIRMMFLNPINLKWLIPNTINHLHPNAPGVPTGSVWYHFLINNGFINTGPRQDGYYQEISNYHHSKAIANKINENEKDGYIIKLYDRETDYGFKELFRALNNPTWEKVVANNLKKRVPDPMLVIVKDDEILGWTGPLYTTKDKRGYFAGIGVHPKAQKRGLGSCLFSELINYSKLNKARYLSLFTGENNVASKIYLKAGFKVVQSFEILSKEIVS